MENMKSMVEKLLADQILNHIDHSPLKRDNGLVLVACGDGDRFPELYDYERKMVERAGNHRIHELILNGGVLQLHPESPLNRNSSSGVLMDQLVEAVKLKSITDIAFYAHYECGAAKMFNFSQEDYFHWLSQAAEFAKDKLKEVLGEDTQINIACKFHYETDPGKKFKTYYFDDQAWNNSQKSSQSASA